MSSTTASNPSRALSAVAGTLTAFASFAVIASLIQGIWGGKPADATSKDRIEKRSAAVADQKALLDKYGLTEHSAEVFEKAATQIKARKESATTFVVPGTPTALKQAATAPAPAAPAAPAQPAAPATNPK